MIVGTANGGVWRTTNADPTRPKTINWTPLTDQLGTNSIGKVVYDPGDPTGNTFYAGTGLWSSAFAGGGPAAGVYKTTDAGASWTTLGTGSGSITGATSVLPGAGAVTAATNASPIVITSANHGLHTGDVVTIAGVQGNNSANGVFTVTVVDANDFSLNGSTGSANYSGGGVWKASIVVTAPDHGLLTGDQVQISGVRGNTAANGRFTITVEDADHFALNGSQANAAYTGGGTWKANIIAGHRVHSLVVSGSTLLVGTVNGSGFDGGPDGTMRSRDYRVLGGALFRSADGGASFEQIGGTGATDLPRGAVPSLLVDPNDSQTVYAAVSGHGIYKSTSGGAKSTWTALNDGLISPAELGGTTDIELDAQNVGGTTTLFAVLESDSANDGNGRIYGVFTLTAGQSTWTKLASLPSSFFPGDDSLIAFANKVQIAADPLNQGVVYVVTEGGAGVYRYDPAAAAWVEIDWVGAQQSFPHADSRDLRFLRASTGTISDAADATPIVITSTGHGLRTGDQVLISGVQGNTAANGQFVVTVTDADHFTLNNSSGNGAYTGGGTWQSSTLMNASDGGIVFVNNPVANNPSNPNSANNPWQSFNGNLATTEFYSLAYDSTNKEFFGGLQDNGNVNQNVPNGSPWSNLTGGDGFVAQVDTTSPGNGNVFRYESNEGETWVLSRLEFNNHGVNVNSIFGVVTGATDASPIVITSPNHGLQTGDGVAISGVLGNTAANNDNWTITRIDQDHFSLNNSAGNGTYLGRGYWNRFGTITQYSATAGGPVTLTSPNHRLQTGDQIYLYSLPSLSSGSVTAASNASPIVITSSNHGLHTGDSVYVSGAMGNTGANGQFTVTVNDADHFTLNNSTGNGAYTGGGTWAHVLYGQDYYVHRIDENTFSLDGTSATLAATATTSYWYLSNNVLLKNGLGEANGSGLEAYDQANIGDYVPYVLNSVDPTHLMLGYTGIYEDAGLSAMAGGHAGDVVADITSQAPEFFGVVSTIVYGGYIGTTGYEDVALVGTSHGRLFFRDHNQTTFADLTNDVANPTTKGGGWITSIAVDPQDYRRVWVTNGDWVFYTANITDLADCPFQVIGGGPNDNLGGLTTQIQKVMVVDVGGTSVTLVAGLGGVFRLLAPPAPGAQATWEQFGTGMPNVLVYDVRYDAGTDTLFAGTLGRGAWSIANASTTLADPFASAAFSGALLAVLKKYNASSGGIPQVSLALLSNGQTFTGGLTNPEFFQKNAQTQELQTLGTSQPTIEADTLFRIGSTGKTFVATALVSLEQQLRTILMQPNYSLLDQPAFSLLGYSAGQTVQGFDPLNPGNMLSATVPANLFNVTVADLLHMQSGINGDATNVASQSFPDAKTGFLFSNLGSYAALQFAGPPPQGQGYAQSANVPQTINYLVYQIAANVSGVFTPARVGLGFDYQDMNFELGADIVDTLAVKYNLAVSYGDYLQRYVLGPLGIQAPPAQGTPATNALFGPEHSEQSQSFPTEVTYYREPPGPPNIYSVTPDPSRTKAPFYNPTKVYGQYGQTNTNPEFNGASVATPAATVLFQNYLSQVIEAGPNGNVGGPLTYASVAELLSPPASDQHPAIKYFGLGLFVIPDVNDPTNLSLASWNKGGNKPGTLSAVRREPNGNIFAAVFNAEPPMGQFNGLLNDVFDLMRQYGQATYLQTPAGSTPQQTKVNTAYATPLTAQLASTQGQSVAGVPITFLAPVKGPSGTFANGQTSITVLTDDSGVAQAPFTANAKAGAFSVTAYNPVAGAVTFQLTNTPVNPLAAVAPVSPMGTATLPNSDADASFVRALYLKVLGREAEPDGLDHWVALLQQGVSRLDVARAVWGSREHRGYQVDAYYRAFLGRGADPVGRADWVNAFLHGASEVDVARGFLTSAEYRGRHAADFVEAVYRDVLGAQVSHSGPEPSGPELSALVDRVLHSDVSAREVVESLYLALLDRDADRLGLEARVRALLAGQLSLSEAAVQLLASQEFLDQIHP
jgi:hypothetical protein